ncbi:PLP-dependent aminotransferase family protein [Solihabitans fulvus]|uniref:PLP-dependent aminotransferase family protein n=1 Tax=Solihabitans fulvus TaxID=1892852 RepID=A0A5B2X282_9PSEU|nr:PLP-dependent aminotransferase family protein [Solihabitans fulvus]KAA2257278.1 PLP-dependent aminotransferase family protein [Solihabitans fulvus]
MTETTLPRGLALTDLHASLADPLLEAMMFLNEVTSRFPEAISFAPGRPYEGLFEPERITDYLADYTAYLERDLGFTPDQVRTTLFQYGRTNGQIHDLIAKTVANDDGMHVSADSVVVTVGAQEGMLLALRALFARPTDVLLVTSPCYVGITGAARLLDIETVPVPEGESGLDPEAVAEAAARVAASGRRARALYVVPDFANPSGTSMAVPARRRLLEVADAADLLVIEDNPYGFFSRDEQFRPTLKSLDTERRVIYLGSFAKTCFPGARLGYVLADQEVVAPDGGRTLLADQLAKIKSMTTVNTPSLSQAVIGGILVRSGCRLRDTNQDTIRFYRNNLNLLLDELDRHFPITRRASLGIDWNTPGGGFFVVVTVPFVVDNRALERSARDYGVLWTPMSSFYLDGGGQHQLRLSCSYVEPDRLRDGLARLAQFITDQTATFAGQKP